MEAIDLFLGPLYAVIFLLIGLGLRNSLTDKVSRKYFLPGLVLKMVGAIFLGLIYQFYYGGGDTFNYYMQSKVMFEAFGDSPSKWLILLFSKGEISYDVIEYINRIWWYDAPKEMIVIKFASFFSLFSFNSYTVISLFFANASFYGLWAMYRAFYKISPQLHKEIAIAIFFMPSVFFWGSGLMKDTICLGALGFLFNGFYFGAIEKKSIIKNLTIAGFSLVLILKVKAYIALGFIPPAAFWVFNENSARIKSSLIRIIAKPVLLIIGGGFGYYAMTQLTEGTAYDLNNIAETAAVTANWIHYVSVEQGGAAYSLGELDGSLGSMFRMFPAAVNVSLFRPYLYEVRNPVMLLSAIEATYFLLFTLFIFYKSGLIAPIKYVINTPIVNLCIVFSIIFAFAVGATSFNFGSLVRYKIPLMPFYLIGLYMIADKVIQKKVKKPTFRR